MTFLTKYLQFLTCGLLCLALSSCGSVKVEPVEEGDSLRYHARVGYFLQPPELLKVKYIKDLTKYSKVEDFVRCEPSAIVRLHSRFERRYVEVQQGNKTFLFDTIAGKPIELISGTYQLIDRFFKKEFPLPTDVVRKLGHSDRKDNLICAGKVWVGMTTQEFLIARPPPHNIISSRKGKTKTEKWQFETKNHFLKEYIFVNDVLEKHSDN